MELIILLAITLVWIGVNKICSRLENIETALLIQSMELKNNKKTDI